MSQCLLRSQYCKLYIKNDLIFRTISNSTIDRTQNGLKVDLKKVKVDQVSVVPHPVSKLRLYRYVCNSDETPTEKDFRSKRIRLQELNHDFWTQINTQFNEKKKEYIQNELKNKKIESDLTTMQTHEELAQFYRKFLNDHHQQYIEYNISWYKENIRLLWPSFLVSIIRTHRKLLSKWKQ